MLIKGFNKEVTFSKWICKCHNASIFCRKELMELKALCCLLTLSSLELLLLHAYSHSWHAKAPWCVAQRAFSFDCKITYIINQIMLLKNARRDSSCVSARINIIYQINILYTLCQKSIHLLLYFVDAVHCRCCFIWRRCHKIKH